MNGWPTHLLTRTQAAEVLAVSPWSLDRLRREKGLPAIDVGGTWRYDPADLQNFINNNRRSETNA